jgi:geranylgeranyl diphosphate synthase type I
MFVMTERADRFTTTDPAELLARARQLCEPGLRDALASLPEPLSTMAAYQFGWCEPDGTPTQAGWGKGLRAALALAAATACGSNPTAAAPAAIAVELLHNFTLVHDDVMDGDRLRRGRPTIWCVWGIPDAICLGDALHASAAQILVTWLPNTVAADAVARLETATAELCRGQSEDYAFETRSGVGVKDYLAMATNKTGTLMGCACALGALCTGADTATIEALDTFGRRLGLAFQIVDDLLGVWGDPTVTGKPAGADLIRRTQSFPVVAALESKNAAAAQLSQLYRSDRPITHRQAARAAADLDAAGDKQATQQQAQQWVSAALAALPEQMAASDLITLAYLVAHRDW